jgi:hypothetical protein
LVARPSTPLSTQQKKNALLPYLNKQAQIKLSAYQLQGNSMTEQERELDFQVVELQQENSGLRAQLVAEVTVLTELVRVLSAKVAELEAEKTRQA